MKILVTNDDGMFAGGLWVLARELKKLGDVAVVSPDREQSAIGTAITLTQPLRVQKTKPLVPGVESYAVQGTPGDAVILALEKLVEGVDVVVSGINEGLNVGSDVLISGTVGAALQGYLRGLPSIAVSIRGTDKEQLACAARVVSHLVQRIRKASQTGPVLLNVNLPDRDPRQILGVRLTQLASETHVDTAQEGHDGKRSYYWLVRKRRPGRSHAEGTDVFAVDRGYVSLTPLHIYDGHDESGVGSVFCSETLCGELAAELGIR